MLDSIVLRLALLLATTGSPAYAAEPPVGLGTAASYAVLAGSTVTNTGPSVISGSVGLAPGTSVTGFPPGIVTPPGTTQVDNDAARTAKADLVTAYNDAAGRSAVTEQISADLGGRTLTAGVYKADSEMSLNGTLTLNGGPDDVFIFQAGSTLITGSSATVALTGGASACNVFWQVGSSATLGTDTTFVGTIMALASATLETRAKLTGRVLAREAAVTLDTNVINVPACGQTDTPTDTGGTEGGTGGGTDGGTEGGTGGGTDGGTGTGIDTGTGTGAGSGTTTVVPIGHPETGVAPTADADLRLLFLGGLVLGGAALAGSHGRRRPAAVTS